MYLKRENFLPFALPLFDDNEINEVIDTIKSGWVSKGPKTSEFEKRFADFVGVKHAIAMNSCTAALHTALTAKGIGPGDEVITSPLTFAATVNVIEHTGARPVFADIDRLTYNIDAGSMEEKITEKTKAIIPVHFAGQACDMDSIRSIADNRGLFVLDDAAHAVFTRYKGRIAGSLGDATAFSFYATKNLSTGEGGMLTTNDDELAEKARIISLHGMSKNAWNRYGKGGSWYYEILYPGFKYNMTDLQAALGLHQLEKLESMQVLRQEYVHMYNEAFKDLDGLMLPYVEPGNIHAWHLYVIQVDSGFLNIDRQGFIDELTKRNIGTSVHFIPVHLHPYYRDKYNYSRGSLPVAESVYERIVSLPLYPKMTRQDVEDVINAVRDICEEYRK